MNQVIVYYNPFLPKLKISINGKKLSSYSSLMSFQNQRLEKWSGCLFVELYCEINTDYKMICISNEFTSNWLETLANRDPHCISFESQPLPMNANVYERLYKLELLGVDKSYENIIIPVVNMSDNKGMTMAVYEVLEEQDIFKDVSEEGFIWEDCPLTNVEIKTIDSSDKIDYDVPAVIALCDNVDDSIRLDTDAPIYALVMGTETYFVKQKDNVFYFIVEPNDLGKIFLGIIEEEALCPLLSYLSYNFPEYSKEFLTESEKEDLELICSASIKCNVTLPKVCDIGRPVALDISVYPSYCNEEVRITTDSSNIVIDNNILYPRAIGNAEVNVFIGNDPYPVASGKIIIRERILLTDIVLFPSILYLPLEGTDYIKVSVVPENAENRSEICWKSSDSTIATVDYSTGMIKALSCGRCTITAFTEEASKTISVEVQPEIKDIICPSGYLELSVGERKEWKYQIVPNNGYGSDLLRVVSSDNNVAEYRGGYVIGNNTGECRMYLKNPSGTINRELKVSVKKNRKFW